MSIGEVSYNVEKLNEMVNIAKKYEEMTPEVIAEMALTMNADLPSFLLAVGVSIVITRNTETFIMLLMELHNNYGDGEGEEK